MHCDRVHWRVQWSGHLEEWRRKGGGAMVLVVVESIAELRDGEKVDERRDWRIKLTCIPNDEFTFENWLCIKHLNTTGR